MTCTPVCPRKQADGKKTPYAYIKYWSVYHKTRILFCLNPKQMPKRGYQHWYNTIIYSTDYSVIFFIANASGYGQHAYLICSNSSVFFFLPQHWHCLRVLARYFFQMSVSLGLSARFWCVSSTYVLLAKDTTKKLILSSRSFVWWEEIPFALVIRDISFDLLVKIA